jgi:hypothetical protein
MNLVIKHVAFVLLLAVLISGCGAGDNPSSPDLQQDGNSNPNPNLNFTENAGSAGSTDTHHYLLTYNNIYVDATDPDDIKLEVVPARFSEIHVNILILLEAGPCFNCFKVVDFSMVGFRRIDVDIEITHPISDPTFTCFDARGIMMFTGSNEFWFSGKKISDPEEGDGCLLNPDGYTSLYNPETEFTAPGPLFGYYKGNFSSMYPPDATVNAYKRHISDDPANTRNAFYAGDSVVNTYELYLGDWIMALGYAVDVSWAMPISTPVDDPMTDFGLDANSAEPWKIVVSEDPPGGGIDQDGGETKIIIDVYDWQGSASHTEPLIEAPGFSDGIQNTIWVLNTDEYSRYETTVTPFYYPPPGGFYPCLIAVEDNENDPVNQPWLDQTAYMVYEIRVEGPPVAIAESESEMQTMGTPLYFYDNGSFDADGGDIVLFEWDWDNDAVYDESGSDAYHTWEIEGKYQVQFRVTDDEGNTGELYAPLEITITQPGVPASPVELTPPDLNFYPVNVKTDGDYTYIAGYGNGLHIFNTSNPANPQWINNVEIPGDVKDVAVQDGYAYVANGWGGLSVVDVYPPYEASIVKNVEGIIGNALAISADYAYVIGENYGMTIIDISEPSEATIIKMVDFPSEVIWGEDICYSNGYVVIAARFDGVMLYDVDPPQLAHHVSTVNEFMNVAMGVAARNGIAYVCDSNLGLRIIDFTTPESPVVLADVHMGSGWPRDVVLVGNYAYVAAESWGGIKIVNIYDPPNAFVENELDTPGYACGVSWQNGMLFIADSWAGLTVADVSSPGSEHIVAEVDTLGLSYDAATKDGYAYVCDRSGGLSIVDVDPPESAHLVKTIDLYGYALEMEIVGNTGYVVGGAAGLYIINVNSPGNASVISNLDMEGYAQAIDVEGNYAYIANDPDGLQIVNITNSMYPALETAVEVPGEAVDVAYAGGYVYIADEDNGLQVIDVDPLLGAHIVNTVAMPGYDTNGVAVHGNYAIVVEEGDGIQVVDISTPETASIVNTVLTYYGNGIEIFGDYAYISLNRMRVYDVSDPMAMYEISEFPGKDGISVYIEGNMAYMSAGDRGLRIYQLW